ncbi:CmcI family methyltransferase [Halomonas sp. I5-271120]|uniref:CmcI family methyltransferase n=1 Tax=Halomonas sp. I5-271120 TaxID=3061632 RepID=UPI0027147074|nr:CmcI family methyltransferase [Halomonas sp. I5-271120]
MIGQPLRLSRFAVFVDYGDFIEVQHAVRRERHCVDRATYEYLREFLGFSSAPPGFAQWVELGVLVEPFTDTLAGHGPASGSEAALAADYQRWYWRHEIETERDYCWLGEVVVKMPSDLFYLQELLMGAAGRRVLELGRGRGGGVWFLSSVLHLLGGGLVVSVDTDPQEPAIDGSCWSAVGQHMLIGDALSQETLTSVCEITRTFDVIVIDLGGDLRRNLAALGAWVEFVSKGGTVVIEDLWGHDDEEALQAIDEFLLEHRNFGLCEYAVRHPLLKGIGLRRSLK